MEIETAVKEKGFIDNKTKIKGLGVVRLITDKTESLYAFVEKDGNLTQKMNWREQQDEVGEELVSKLKGVEDFDSMDSSFSDYLRYELYLEN